MTLKPWRLPVAEGPSPKARARPWSALGQAESNAQQTDPAEARIAELERMLEEMRSKAELAEREAFEKAFAAGEEAGMQLGRKRAETMLAELGELLDEAQRAVERLQEELADAAWDFVEAVVREALGRELADAQGLRDAIERALQKELPAKAEVVLVVSPSRLEALQEWLGEHEALLRVQADASLADAQARLMLRAGAVLIDASSAVRRALRHWR